MNDKIYKLLLLLFTISITITANQTLFSDLALLTENNSY